MKDFFEKYADRIMPEPMSGCFLWFGSATTSGYGNFTRWNVTHYAHRAAFECVNGDGSAEGWHVRHKCDTPACCNPGHLLIGTHADNMADARIRNRMKGRPGPKGETSPRAKFSDETLRRLRAAGRPWGEVRHEIGISKTHYYRVLRGEPHA